VERRHKKATRKKSAREFQKKREKKEKLVDYLAEMALLPTLNTF
jgi:hypothetical protein